MQCDLIAANLPNFCFQWKGNGKQQLNLTIFQYLHGLKFRPVINNFIDK